MSEKKPLADELLREILKEQLREVYGDYTIGYSAYNVVMDFNSTADAERFVGLKGGVGIIVHDRIVLLDLYRLAAMGRAWARTVGFTISDMALSNGGGMICIYKNIPEPTDEDVDSYESEQDIGYSPIHSHHKTELSATFAAISAVWGRVKG